MSIAKFQSVALAFVGAVIFASLFVGAAGLLATVRRAPL